MSSSPSGASEPPIEQTGGRVQANGITLAYRIYGPPDREVVLMIPGVGGQMGEGPDLLAEAVVRRGYRVIVYDSRDSGQSTHFDAAGAPDWVAIQKAMEAGRPPPVAYTLDDMARDAIGLLDALGVRKAHLAGGSLGGMVAQIVAAEYPERTLSLTSISSSTGNPALPAGRAQEIMGVPAPEGDPEALIDHHVRMAQAMGSPGYPTDEKVLRQRIAEALKNAPDPARAARQGAAAALGGDRRARLKTIEAPTVVLHGADDPMFPVEHGKDTAASIPGAELRVIPGLGHDLPDALVPVFADAIAAAAKRAPRP
jgi:pimeloyl-ACP methyl ester carboxylesterase